MVTSGFLGRVAAWILAAVGLGLFIGSAAVQTAHAQAFGVPNVLNVWSVTARAGDCAYVTGNVVAVHGDYVSSSGTASADIEYAPYYAWKAFDGDAVGWRSPLSVGNLYYDFGAAKTINGARFYTSAAGVASYYAPDVVVFYGSNDGVTWTALFTGGDTANANNDLGYGEWYTAEFSATYRYYRMEAKVSDVSRDVIVSELEFLGDVYPSTSCGAIKISPTAGDAGINFGGAGVLVERNGELVWNTGTDENVLTHTNTQGINADKVDNIDSTQFARVDAATDFTTAPTINSATIWTAANDGPASGLAAQTAENADRVDGVHLFKETLLGWDIASTAAGGWSYQDVAIAGTKVGDPCISRQLSAGAGSVGLLMTCHVIIDGKVRLEARNISGTTVNPAPANYDIIVFDIFQ